MDGSRPYHLLCKCLLATGELKEAKKICFLLPESKMSQKVLSAQTLHAKIVQEMSSKDYEAALENLSSLLRTCSHSVEFVCLKIECLHKALMVDEACEYIDFVRRFGGDLVTRRNMFKMWIGKNLVYTGKQDQGMELLSQIPSEAAEDFLEALEDTL